MTDIDWAGVLRAITATGMTQEQIAAHCGCGQTTISDLCRGGTAVPRAGLGLRLLGLAVLRGAELQGAPADIGRIVAQAANQEGARHAA